VRAAPARMRSLAGWGIRVEVGAGSRAGRVGRDAAAIAGRRLDALNRLGNKCAAYIPALARRHDGGGGEWEARRVEYAAPLSATTRLRLPVGGWMPFIGLGTSALP
jgi:hypothetical protein